MEKLLVVTELAAMRLARTGGSFEVRYRPGDCSPEDPNHDLEYTAGAQHVFDYGFFQTALFNRSGRLFLRPDVETAGSDWIAWCNWRRYLFENLRLEEDDVRPPESRWKPIERIADAEHLPRVTEIAHLRFTRVLFKNVDVFLWFGGDDDQPYRKADAFRVSLARFTSYEQFCTVMLTRLGVFFSRGDVDDASDQAEARGRWKRYLLELYNRAEIESDTVVQ